MAEASGKHQRFWSDKSGAPTHASYAPISRLRSQAFLSVTDAWPEDPMSEAKEDLLRHAPVAVLWVWWIIYRTLQLLNDYTWSTIEQWQGVTLGGNFVTNAFNQAWFAFLPYCKCTASDSSPLTKLDTSIPCLCVRRTTAACQEFKGHTSGHKLTLIIFHLQMKTAK